MNLQEYYLGLDIGGTKIEAALLHKVSEATVNTFSIKSSHFKVIGKKRILTQREKGYDFVLQEISELVVSTCKDHNVVIGQLSAIGMGLPGSITPQTSIMINGNSDIFIGKNIIEDLKSKLNFNKNIYVDNDANLFALAEAFLGAGLEYQKQTGLSPIEQVSIGIILGTGCGGGVIINGQQLIGRNGGGAEVGHSILVKDGVQCYCGRKGCAEQYLSGSGLELMFHRMTGIEMKGEKIFEGVTSDKKCKQVIDCYLEHLSLFLTNLTNIFDPDYIVLGGGVSKQSSMYKVLNENNKKMSFIPNSSTEIYQHVLSDSAGVLGAALLPILNS